MLFTILIADNLIKYTYRDKYTIGMGTDCKCRVHAKLRGINDLIAFAKSPLKNLVVV